MRNHLTLFRFMRIGSGNGSGKELLPSPSSSRCQHSRIVLRHDIIHLFCQIVPLKSDVRGSLLEVTDKSSS